MPGHSPRASKELHAKEQSRWPCACVPSAPSPRRTCRQTRIRSTTWLEPPGPKAAPRMHGAWSGRPKPSHGYPVLHLKDPEGFLRSLQRTIRAGTILSHRHARYPGPPERQACGSTAGATASKPYCSPPATGSTRPDTRWKSKCCRHLSLQLSPKLSVRGYRRCQQDSLELQQLSSYHTLGATCPRPGGPPN